MSDLVLVTGGTGFVGREVVKQLTEAGYRVRLLARRPRRAVELARRFHAEVAPGDVTRPDTLPSALRGVTAVIHLVGIIKETRFASFAAVHADGSRHLIRAAREAGVKRFLLMSALGTRANARSNYHRTKAEAEEALRDSGLDDTIFRPSIIYGPGDHALSALRKLFVFPNDLLLGYSLPDLGGTARVQPVHVADVARCFVRALGAPASLGQTYEVVGPASLTWQELLVALGASRGKKVLFETWPFLFTVRCVLWTITLLIPLLFLILQLIPGGPEINWGWFVLGFLGWVALAAASAAWRTWIFFRVPAAFVRLPAEALDPLLPRAWRVSEQLKMLEEDNVGNPGAVARDLGVSPRPLALD